MNKIFSIFMLLIVLSSDMKAQSDTTFRRIRAITGDIIDFTVDNLDIFTSSIAVTR